MTGWLGAGVVGAGALVVAVLGLRRRLAALREAVARAGHEVRGPLCAARLGLELVRRSAGAPPVQLRALELELDRIELALADLEGAGGGARAGLDIGPVGLEQLLVDCVSAWRPAAATRGLEISVRWIGPPATMAGDRVRLAQALENLIANALEHGGGSVEVRGSRDGSGVRVEVIDGGPGLPAPVPDLIRRRRRRRERPERGRGLGIAQAAARAHGGELTTAPSRDGARLVLRLPLSGGGAPAQNRVVHS